MNFSGTAINSWEIIGWLTVVDISQKRVFTYCCCMFTVGLQMTVISLTLTQLLVWLTSHVFLCCCLHFIIIVNLCVVLHAKEFNIVFYVLHLQTSLKIWLLSNLCLYQTLNTFSTTYRSLSCLNQGVQWQSCLSACDYLAIWCCILEATTHQPSGQLVLRCVKCCS